MIGGRGLQKRHGWLQKENEVISGAWKGLLLFRISMLSGAFEQEKAGKEYIYFVLSAIMVSVGIFTSGGEF